MPPETFPLVTSITFEISTYCNKPCNQGLCSQTSPMERNGTNDWELLSKVPKKKRLQPSGSIYIQRFIIVFYVHTKGFFSHICLCENSIFFFFTKWQYFITCGSVNGQYNSSTFFGFIHKNQKRFQPIKLLACRSGFSVCYQSSL